MYDYTLKFRKFDPTDARLGRRVLHDSRSLRFQVQAGDPMLLASVRHKVNIPILDQGNLGSCTGHAGTAVIASEAFWTGGSVVLATTDPHEYAVDLYSAATKIDPWEGQYEPDDTGSDGLSIAKVLRQRELISGYLHATSLNATLTALAKNVVMVGTSWLTGMYEPDVRTGKLNVTGSVEGGHEYVLDEIDVERQRVWIRNSWSAQWGIQGRAWMSWADLGKLLADQGDCTVLLPRTEPVPTPQPQPEPKQPEETHALAEALLRLVDNRSAPRYILAPAHAWLKANGYAT